MTAAGSTRKKRRSDYLVLLATILAASMAFVGSTALNVSLPAIQHDLAARGADLLWISNAYVIVQAALIVIGGSLSDYYGRNRICLLGILIFAVASLVCGLAASTGALIVGRFVQGIGGAMIIPSSLAIVSANFEYNRQGWAIGVWSAFTLLTSGSGPIIGGILTEMGLWRAVFLVHIPLGVVAAFLLLVYIPESDNTESKQRVSITSGVLVTLGLLGITFGFTESPQYGFGSPLILLSIAGGVIALAAFIWDEQRHEYSLMPLDLFKSRTLSGANLVTVLLYGALGPANFYLPLNMIQIQGYSETFVGLALLPLMILPAVLSYVVGNVVDHHGPRIPMMVGQLLLAVGFVLFATIGTTSGQDMYWTTFFPPICLFGIGLGIALAPLTAAAVGSVSHTHAGIASGINNTISRSSQVLAIAIMGGLAIAMFSQSLLSDPVVTALPEDAQGQLAVEAAKLGETAPPQSLTPIEREEVSQVVRESFAAAFNVLMWVGAVLSLAGAVLSGLLIERDWHSVGDEDGEKEDFVLQGTQE